MSLKLEDERPLYRQLEALLESRIRKSEFSPGELIPSDRQLCKEYSVSYLTARQAVGELVKRGLLVRKQGKGTYVTDFPGTDVSLRNIGLICTSGGAAYRGYYSVIVDGIESVCNEGGYSLQLYLTAGDSLFDRRNQLLRELIGSGKISGVIILDDIPENEIKTLLEGRKVPAVSIFKYKNFDCASVTVDVKKGGYDLTRYLIAAGHRRIALAIRPLDNGLSEIVRNSNQFFEGYREALVSAGIEFNPRLVREAEANSESARGPISELLKGTPRCTALIAAHQSFVGIAAQEAAERGLKVPDDLSIAGLAEADFDPFYTAIVMPTNETGSNAARLLFRLINGEKIAPSGYTKLVCKLRQGKSTAKIPSK